jgi:hypothetical protein
MKKDLFIEILSKIKGVKNGKISKGLGCGGDIGNRLGWNGSF